MTTLNAVRGFVALTAAVLAAIAIGAGLQSALLPVYGPPGAQFTAAFPSAPRVETEGGVTVYLVPTAVGRQQWGNLIPPSALSYTVQAGDLDQWVTYWSVVRRDLAARYRHMSFLGLLSQAPFHRADGVETTGVLLTTCGQIVCVGQLEVRSGSRLWLVSVSGPGISNAQRRIRSFLGSFHPLG